MIVKTLVGLDQPRPHGHMSLFFRRDIWPWGRGWDWTTYLTTVVPLTDGSWRWPEIKKEKEKKNPLSVFNLFRLISVIIRAIALSFLMFCFSITFLSYLFFYYFLFELYLNSVKTGIKFSLHAISKPWR